MTGASDARSALRRARRIVVKVGSGVLTRDGQVRTRMFGDLARQLSALCDQGREVVLVSSGAIAMGSRELGWSHPGRSIPEKQAAAAVGQIGLFETYRRRFARRGRRVAQILLTRSGLQDRERFLNARHTFQTLIELGVVPIVNENDTVATEEIRFGDNDNLSAHGGEPGGRRAAGDPHRRGRPVRASRRCRAGRSRACTTWSSASRRRSSARRRDPPARSGAAA